MKRYCRLCRLLVWSAFLLGCLDSGAAQSPGAGPSSPDPDPKASTVLAPFVVSTKPIGSFGLSVKAVRLGPSGKISELTILDVVADTDADRQGLVPLTQILSIDGRNVEEFSASFDKGTDLNLKLIDRKRGDRITLEVLVPGARKPKRVKLTERQAVHEFPNQTDSEVEPLRTVHIGLSH